ncbi:MAG: AAA family ATPase [Endomicrobium sp.]|nr:AAA family ATPase [Endomicrobium sp.]
MNKYKKLKQKIRRDVDTPKDDTQNITEVPKQNKDEFTKNITAEQGTPEGINILETKIHSSIFPSKKSTDVEGATIRTVANKAIELPANFRLTTEFKNLYDEIITTNNNFYINGRAGTGKSTFLFYLRKNSDKKIIFLAPTGVASLNISGQTLHSFFRFDRVGYFDKKLIRQFPPKSILESIDTIVIDEISMVSSNMLDIIDYSLKTALNSSKPFGGKQMILIGDIGQLPPIIKGTFDEAVRAAYGSVYFFNSYKKIDVFKQLFHFRKLTKVFRQTDEDYITFLDKVRYSSLDANDYARINNEHVKRSKDTSITLTTTRNAAESINKQRLEKLDSKSKFYKANIKYFCSKKKQREIHAGEWPTLEYLELKKGAMVMILVNDPDVKEKRYANGTIGMITEMYDNKIRILVKGYNLTIQRHTWEISEYLYAKETGKMQQNVLASFEQFPVKLAYAMTIHKSQGITLDDVNIDFGNGVFAPGQAYVAFSRIRGFSGLNLVRPIKPEDFKSDMDLVNFEERYINNPDGS